MSTQPPRIHIEVWSDVACPFCYIGKRHLETALEAFPHKEQVDVEWKSFQLQPDAPRNEDGSLRLDDMLAQKMGISAQKAHELNEGVSSMAKATGLAYNLEKTIPANTLQAHKLLHLAKRHGVQNEVKESLMAAYFTEGKHVGTKEGLLAILRDSGIPAKEIEAALDGEDFAYDVKADLQEGQSLGIAGVPFFVFNRSVAISGAQPVSLFSEVLEKVWSETNKN